MSEHFSIKCYVRYNETLGRYIEAAQHISAGEVILSEKPAIIIPQWESVPRCSNCYRETIKTCSKCKIFPLCMSCTSHTYSDCALIEKFENISNKFLIENFPLFGPLKCLLLTEHPNMEDIWERFLGMESHIEERRETDVWKEHEQNVVKPFMESGLAKYFTKISVDSELLQKICGILDVNTFDIRGPDIEPLRAIYISAALLPHDCVANTMISIDGNQNMKIYANLPIKKGEIVYYNYTNPLLGTVQRKVHLKVGKYFDCICKRCKDPTELGSYMSALTCSECKGYLLYADSNWTCNKCSKILDNEQVEQMLAPISEAIMRVQDIRQMEALIAKYTPILNPNHYMIIDLKQNVASILRSVLLNASSKPGKPVIKRKIQLCQEILPVLEIIQPGISRLKAIGIYEYCVPLVQLAKRDFEDSIISNEDYLSVLRKGENLLKEALQMLLYEPADTPEGELAKSAFQEMKVLRNTIDELCAKIDKEQSL